MNSPGPLADAARRLTEQTNESGDPPPPAALENPLIEILMHEIAGQLPPEVRQEFWRAGDSGKALDWVAVGVVMRRMPLQDGMKFLAEIRRDPGRIGTALLNIQARNRALKWMERLIGLTVLLVFGSLVFQFLSQ